MSGSTDQPTPNGALARTLGGDDAVSLRLVGVDGTESRAWTGLTADDPTDPVGLDTTQHDGIPAGGRG